MIKLRNAAFRSALFLFALILAYQLQSCDTSESTGSTISIGFNTAQGLSKTNLESIELDTIKILMRDIKLEFESDSIPGHHGEHHPHRSEGVKAGPFVVYLNLNGTTTDFAVADIPAGFYNEIKFKIHKVEGSEIPPDPEFKEGENESQRYSVIVKGKYNNVPFIYKSRKPAHQKVRLDSLLEVVENTLTDLTITVDPGSWFLNGTTELDPTDSTNFNLIDNNIARSFRGAYCETHHNGHHHH